MSTYMIYQNLQNLLLFKMESTKHKNTSLYYIVFVKFSWIWRQWKQIGREFYSTLGGCRYDSDCFPRLIYTSEATRLSNMMALRSICQKGLILLINNCLFGDFWCSFTYIIIILYSFQYHYLVNTCWPKVWRIFFLS